MTSRARLRPLRRGAATGGMACGLALVLFCPPARADIAATLLRLELDAPEITVAFRDQTSWAVRHSLILTPQSNNGGKVLVVTWDGASVPGEGRVLTDTVNAHILPGIDYCGVIETILSSQKGTTREDDSPVVNKYTSNQICTKASKEPGSNPADVSVGSIDGEAAPPPGTNRNYWIHYANNGTTEAKDVTLQVQATGTMTMRRPPDSGTFHGFQCAASGSGYRCTGGTLPAGAKGQIPFLGRVTTAGPGAIHVTIGAPGETNPTNNAQTLGILSAS
ncbi:hypothetical protein ACIPW5_21300 [Streptomyces sp. NPDC090077]|uniref:hypothetical protein n=1 Tax=Streptomyces sp. NPDC090077 TaxID=3365938 RepID=UPI003812AC26